MTENSWIDGDAGPKGEVEWIPWHGLTEGPPVNGASQIRFKRRDGGIGTARDAGVCTWKHSENGEDFDIMEYTVEKLVIKEGEIFEHPRIDQCPIPRDTFCYIWQGPEDKPIPHILRGREWSWSPVFKYQIVERYT